MLKTSDRLQYASIYVLNSVIADPHPHPLTMKKVIGFRRISQVVLAVAGGSGPLDPPGQRRACEEYDD